MNEIIQVVVAWRWRVSIAGCVIAACGFSCTSRPGERDVLARDPEPSVELYHRGMVNAYRLGEMPDGMNFVLIYPNDRLVRCRLGVTNSWNLPAGAAARIVHQLRGFGLMNVSQESLKEKVLHALVTAETNAITGEVRHRGRIIATSHPSSVELIVRALDERHRLAWTDLAEYSVQLTNVHEVRVFMKCVTYLSDFGNKLAASGFQEP